MIRIVVATHKKYRMPKDHMYLPLQVGRAIHEDIGYRNDNTGENISGKNPNYCELTALFWEWKNLHSEYAGLVHYRRHFYNGGSFAKSLLVNKWDNILTKETAEELLRNYDVILPKKRHYWIETSKSHYEHAHNINDLMQARLITEQKYPDYLPFFDKAMGQTASHRFNMFIMKKKLLDEYCKWLFSILFELEKEIDISGYSPKEARVYGYISERLLDVWISKNKLSYFELPVMFMEKQNWLKKGSAFLERKFFSQH